MVSLDLIILMKSLPRFASGVSGPTHTQILKWLTFLITLRDYKKFKFYKFVSYFRLTS